MPKSYEENLSNHVDNVGMLDSPFFSATLPPADSSPRQHLNHMIADELGSSTDADTVLSEDSME